MESPSTLAVVLGSITPFAMVDTIASIPGHIACLTPLLASRQPKLAVSAYSGGVFAGGILSGIVVALGMQKITQWVVDHVDAINYPGPVFLSIQGLLGLLLVIVGIRLFRRRALPATASGPAPPGRADSALIIGAFVFALVNMFTRLPAALPYFATIDRLLTMATPTETKLLGLVYHNTLLVSPYLTLVLLSVVLPRRSEHIRTVLQHGVDRWGRTLISSLLIILGLLLAIDVAGQRAGHPVLPLLPVERSGPVGSAVP